MLSFALLVALLHLDLIETKSFNLKYTYIHSLSKLQDISKITNID